MRSQSSLYAPRHWNASLVPLPFFGAISPLLFLLWCHLSLDRPSLLVLQRDTFWLVIMPSPRGARHGCQMAIARFLYHMCLALRSSGLWLRYATLQNLIPSFPWHNPRRVRDQILLSGNLGAELQRGERRPANDMTVKRREGGERSRKEGLGSLSDRRREGEN